MDTFIKGLIRAGLKKWGPKNECIRNARVSRGWYACAYCRQKVPATIVRELKTKPGVMKRTKNIYADHIQPIIDPEVGRRSWDEVIERSFVDTECYQALCYTCHTEKTSEEREVRLTRIRAEKLGEVE